MNNDTPSQVPENELPAQTNNLDDTQVQNQPGATVVPQASVSQPTTAIGSGSSQPNDGGIWVSKQAYNMQVDHAEKQRRKARNNTLLTRTFYIMLGLAGLIFALFVIANLLAPVENNSRGCNTSFVYEISRATAPIFMIYLLIAGIIGTIVSKWYVRTIGIILIVISTLGFFFTSVAFLLSALCGV